MPTFKTLCTRESLPLPFSFCMSQNNIFPQTGYEWNYRGYFQTEGTGVEKGRTYLC